ncbi:MAG: hypothetical protein RIR86_2616, partial [Acidobacteriota bacterium]
FFHPIPRRAAESAGSPVPETAKISCKKSPLLGAENEQEMLDSRWLGM